VAPEPPEPQPAADAVLAPNARPAPPAGTSPTPGSAQAFAWSLPRGVILLLGTAAGFISLLGIREYADIVGPLFLAIIIVIAAHPLQGWLRARGAPSWAALLATLATIYGGLIGFVLLLVVSLARLAGLLPQYTSQFNNLQQQVQDLLEQYGVSASQVRDLLSGLDYGRIVGFVTTLLTSLVGVLSGLVLIVCLLFFAVLDANGFGARMGGLLHDRPDIATVLSSFARGTRRYLIVSTVFGFIVAVGDTIALYLLGVSLPLLWGLLAFVTNYIPNVGFVIGVIPPAFVALLGQGWQTAVAVLVVYSVLNFVIQTIIQPKFVGDSVGLSTTVTFVSLLLWAAVLGPLGAILAVPLSLLVKCVLLDADPATSWTGYLIGSSDSTPERVRARAAAAAAADPPVAEPARAPVGAADGAARDR
jgi:predicted PurR-regulated permease PerM